MWVEYQCTHIHLDSQTQWSHSICSLSEAFDQAGSAILMISFVIQSHSQYLSNTQVKSGCRVALIKILEIHEKVNSLSNYITEENDLVITHLLQDSPCLVLKSQNMAVIGGGVCQVHKLWGIISKPKSDGDM